MTINHGLLKLVREALGMTQADVAKRSDIAQGSISKYEKGLQEPSASQLDALAEALHGFPASFFQLGERPAGVMYRTRALRSVKLETTVRGRMNLVRIAVSRLLDDISVADTVRFPDPDREYASPEEAAIQLRRAWGVAPGPITSVSDLLELAGGIVVPADLGSDAVIAAYMHPLGDARRWFFINCRATAGDRIRFSLSHELGHAVLHDGPMAPESAEAESESHRFAAEFLLPREDLLRDVPRRRIHLADLFELKVRFGVSMQSALMSIHRAGLITDSHKTTLFKQISARGWRTFEPGDVPIERPFLLHEALRVHGEQHGYTAEDLERLAMMPRRVLSDLLPDYFAAPPPQLRLA